VHDDGYAAAPCCKVCGQCNVAAEPDDHVRIDAVENRAGLPDRPPHPQRQPHQVTGRLAGQRDRRDQFQVIAALGHQSRFQSTLGAQCSDPHVRVERGESVGHCHRRFDVPRGPAAR
jgi:hypothetical protein